MSLLSLLTAVVVATANVVLPVIVIVIKAILHSCNVGSSKGLLVIAITVVIIGAYETISNIVILIVIQVVESAFPLSASIVLARSPRSNG